LDQARQQLSAAGLQFPLLVKPLVSAATDSARPADAGDSSEGQPSQAAALASVANDGHTLGALFSDQGLQSLIDSQHQEQQELTPISLPAMLQQYVPHKALYKVSSVGLQGGGWDSGSAAAAPDVTLMCLEPVVL
jgi:hypothetical protein